VSHPVTDKRRLIAIVTIDINCLHRLFVAFSDAEALQYALVTGVTTKLRLKQLSHIVCIAV